MSIEDYFKDGKVYIWKETFAVIKAKGTHPRAFANICDKTEITVIIDETQYHPEEVLEVEPGWKIITFDMVLPFGLVGFMARVSGALAEAGISLFAISAFSTDHILVKKENLSTSIDILENMGFSVSQPEAKGS
jgi:hypothetical protein